MPTPIIDNAQPGDPITAEQWDAVASEVKRLANVSAGSGIQITKGPIGTVISLTNPPQSCIVKVTANASGGGKYYARIIGGTSSTAVDTSNLTLPEGLLVPSNDNVLLLNADEDGTATHMLGVNTYHVGLVIGGVKISGKWYQIVVISGANGIRSACLSIGAPARPCMYHVTVIGPPTSDIVVTGTDPVIAGELGASGDSGYGINAMEIGESSNIIAAGSLAVGFLFRTNTDNTAIYIFWGMEGTSCHG